MYEDNVSGKIDDERFARMTKSYSEEQSEIAEKMKKLREELDKTADKTITAGTFIKAVRKYTRAKKLTPQMLNELIDKIEVHQAKKVNGENTQALTIYWNCVGVLEIPDLSKLPDIEITLNTRQGVNITYATKKNSA